MPWGRIDDDFYDHPKVMAIAREIRNDAVGLYWRAISYCNNKRTDGFITEAAVLLLDGSDASIRALVTVKLWHRKRGGFEVHDFLNGYNKSREQVEKERLERSFAGRIGGLASGKSRTKTRSRSTREANGEQTASNDEATRLPVASTTTKQTRTPSRPVPSRPGPLENGGGGVPGSGDAGAMAPVGALLPAVVPSRATTTTTTTDGNR